MIRQFNPIVLILIGLAAFGFLHKLFTNPTSLITQLLITAGLVALFFFVFRAVMNRRYNSSDYSAYRKAAKQSKSKYKQPAAPTRTRAPRSPKPTKLKRVRTKNRLKALAGKGKSSLSRTRNRKETNLTVIEGKKGKKRNRALF